MPDHPWHPPLKNGYAVPTGDHPGAFGAVRKHDTHTGVDLYCRPYEMVYAVEEGVVVNVVDFTGADAGSPWWNETFALLVEGPSGVVCYGEIIPSTNRIGTVLARGSLVGHVLTVLKKDKGNPMTMLHLELYAHGTREPVWWREGSQPEGLLDPTPYLLSADENRDA